LVVERFSKSEEDVKDGMDISLVSLAHSVRGESESVQLKWAGANNPLWIINPKAHPLAGKTLPFGRAKGRGQAQQTTHRQSRQSAALYHPHHRIAKRRHHLHFYRRLPRPIWRRKRQKIQSFATKRVAFSIQDKTMDEQKEFLDQAFENWRGNLEQIDDVCIIGVRI
jgi:hypothetical protein